jgi:hypothetical protein
MFRGAVLGVGSPSSNDCGLSECPASAQESPLLTMGAGQASCLRISFLKPTGAVRLGMPSPTGRQPLPIRQDAVISGGLRPADGSRWVQLGAARRLGGTAGQAQSIGYRGRPHSHRDTPVQLDACLRRCAARSSKPSLIGRIFTMLPLPARLCQQPPTSPSRLAGMRVLRPLHEGTSRRRALRRR